ncbi:MAG: cytochrome b/b6 domain-containing protein [Sulfurospirillum sp.]|nr:cytochrome b/b6 domain-containing protein [Sulfurospirillum sp.]
MFFDQKSYQKTSTCTMNKVENVVFVWPLCTRIIHWIIALSFFFAFVTSFFYTLYTWHICFGFIFGIVLLFRIIWGFIGPYYARFKTFQLSFNALKHYFVEKIQNRWRKIYAGHNAASSWFTILVLFLGSLIVLTGLLLQGTQEASGLFGFLNQEFFQSSFTFAFLHRFVSYFLFACAMVHILGVLIEQFYHKTNMVFAMITGYKKAEGQDTQVSLVLKVFAYGIIIVCAGVMLHVKINGETFLTYTHFEKHDFQSENSAYERCSSCHKPYPPFMLPKDSWVKIMQGLENHFGEKITEHNITKAEQQSIQDYLVAHSAESSSHKLAFKTLHSLGELRPLSMSKVPYWREVHHKIDKKVFDSLHVKSAANCFACHQNFEWGILDATHIHISQ